MPTKVLIPDRLRSLVEKQESVSCEGATVGEILEKLAVTYPGLRKKIFMTNGTIRNLINVYLNDEDIRGLEREGTQVTDTDTIAIVAVPRARKAAE